MGPTYSKPNSGYKFDLARESDKHQGRQAQPQMNRMVLAYIQMWTRSSEETFFESKGIYQTSKMEQRIENKTEIKNTARKSKY